MENEIVNKIKQTHGILDSELIYIKIEYLTDDTYQKEDMINIVCKFRNEIIPEKKITLKFNNVNTYNLSSSKIHGKYYIEQFKLFYIDKEDIYYCSLSPYNENDKIDQRDRNTIRALQIEYLFE